MAKPFYPCDFYNDGTYMIRYSDEYMPPLAGQKVLIT